LVLLLVASLIYFAIGADSQPDEAVPAASAPAVDEQSILEPDSFAEDLAAVAGGELESQQSSLEIQFTEDCWVEVRDASRKILLADMRRAGDIEVLAGEPPYKVVFGKSHAVAVRYQGRQVPVVAENGKNSAQLVIGG
jgi:cytoskeleton protein RodZ